MRNRFILLVLAVLSLCLMAMAGDGGQGATESSEEDAVCASDDLECLNSEETRDVVASDKPLQCLNNDEADLRCLNARRAGSIGQSSHAPAIASVSSGEKPVEIDVKEEDGETDMFQDVRQVLAGVLTQSNPRASAPLTAIMHGPRRVEAVICEMREKLQNFSSLYDVIALPGRLYGRFILPELWD